MFRTITSHEAFDALLEQKPALLAYFSTEECQVCKVLKPRVGEMAAAHFPQMKRVFVEINAHPALAARYRVFTVPTLLVFFEGREYIRKSRSFGLDELQSEIARLCAMQS